MRRVPPIASEQLKPEAVWRFYNTQRSAVLHEKQSVLEMCRSAHAAAPDPQFTGWTLPEIENHFDATLEEVGHQISLSLLAATEASIQVDFWDRVRRKGKDAVSRRFRGLAVSEDRRGNRNLRMRLDDILSVWASEAPNCKGALARFRGALNYRHWLAHGRYWEAKLGMRYSALIVQKTIEDLLEALRCAAPTLGVEEPPI